MKGATPTARYNTYSLSSPKKESFKKGGEKLPSPKTQAVTQKELHAIADEAIGNAKKIYIHYTPQEGNMVIRLLF